MKAVRVHEHGGLEVLKIEEIPTPEPGPGEIRVAVMAVGLNHMDTWVRRGVPGHKFPLPITPGCEGMGAVEKLGPGVTEWKVGEPVILCPGEGCGTCDVCKAGDEHLCRYYGILGETRDGACADFVVVKASRALPMVPKLSFEEAAALPLVYLTAWHMLVARAQVKAGETVLIHAAGSGVSTAAIQIAKLHGARVFATAGSDEKCERARKLGVEACVNYEKTDFYEEIRKLTSKRGCDIVLDHVGQTTMDKSIRLLVKGGRLVTCGTTSGPQIQLDFRHIFFKSLSVLGSTMGTRAELKEILAHAKAGRLKPVIDSTFPLAKIREAHARIGERAVFGKVVVTI